MHVLQKKWIVNVRRRGTKRMSKCSELRQRRNECNKKIIWNRKNICEDCDKGNMSSECAQNDDKNQEEKHSQETNSINERQNKNRRRKRVVAMKVKGEIDDVKEEGVVSLFSINCNGVGPHSAGKQNKLNK